MPGLPPQDFLNFEKRFIYVDAYHEPAKGSRSKWRRVKIDELEAFAKGCHHYNVFATVQQFAIYKQTDNEEQYSHLFFDFDAKEPYKFKDVQEDVEKLKHYFFVAHEIDKTEIRFYFSGSRGMHVLVNPITVGIEPHPELTYIYKNMALYLKNLLDLHTLDPAIYTIRRVLRLPNSVHKTSGCYKIELEPTEVSLAEEEIRKLAHSPRDPLYSSSDYVGLSPNESLKKLYRHFLELYKKQAEINKLKPQKIILKSDAYPICVRDLLDSSIKKSGTRNIATISLACYFKDQGISEDKAFEIIYEWAQKIPKGLTNAKGNELKASTKSCIASIYDDKSVSKSYHFICSVMRTLDVQCNFDKCPIASIKDQEPEKIVEVSLSEASDGAFVNKKLSCKVMIVGKDTSPYLSPGRVQFSCKEEKNSQEDLKDDEKCLNCFVGQHGGRVALDLPKTAQFILETINCTTFQQFQLLKRLYVANNSSCAKLKVEILEYRNIEEVELNPGLENHHKDASEESEYVVRKGFYIGHNLDVNQEFNVVGYVTPEPRTQHAVHIFDEAKPSETSLTSFKMTSEIRKRLEIFQVEKNKSVMNKFNEIYDDLERNILYIWQRRAMLIAMDLVYHSVLRFELNGDLLQRGWTETFIIGDSGQAKTAAYLKLRNHYNLGTRVSGEGSRRTGLAWTWQQTANRWFLKFGIIPNNDRRLVCIDEAAGMAEEELEKLTDMRECVSADTECLTKKGFKKYNELSIGEEIYTLNPKTLLAEWKPIKKLYIYKNYNGEMIEIEGRNISACVTPNHRWLIKIKNGNGKNIYKFKETKEFKKVYKIPLRTMPQKIKKEQIYSDDFVELIGWIITEGCYNASIQISISQSLKANKEKAIRIKNLVKKLTGEENIYYGRHECITVRFSGELAKKIRRLFPDKKLTYGFVNLLTFEQLKILKDTLIAGDGRIRGKRENLYTTEAINKDIFEYICILLGLNCRSHKYLMNLKNPKHKDIYSCRIKISKYTSPFSKEGKRKRKNKCTVKRKNYNGVIWCPNTENQTFFARRNERIYITGNSGIADATGGPIPAKAHARTRLIWMSNARNGQSLRTFMFPIEAIQSVFKKSEDIRRIDFCVGVVTGVVSDDIIHQSAQDMPEVVHRFTSDLCHQLILWAWTRKPKEIIITKEASNAIRDTAMAFGKKYSAKIPIVETAVQRIKIARLAVATAARVFSIDPSDKEGNNLIVLPEHVEFVRDFLTSQYDDSVSLDYLNYTINNRLDSDSIYEAAYEDYARLPEIKQLTSVLKTTKFWVKNDLGDMVGLERDQLQDVMKVLARYRLIEKFRGQYRMTTAGIDFVKRFDVDHRKLPEAEINEEIKILEEEKKEPFDFYDK